MNYLDKKEKIASGMAIAGIGILGLYGLSKYMEDKRKIIPTSETFKCAVCLQSFTSIDALNIHVNTHNSPGLNEFYCETCGATFESQAYLDEHIIIAHTVNPLSNYECSICHSTFGDITTYQEHLLTHSNDPPIIPPSTTTWNIDMFKPSMQYYLQYFQHSFDMKYKLPFSLSPEYFPVNDSALIPNKMYQTPIYDVIRTYFVDTGTISALSFFWSSTIPRPLPHVLESSDGRGMLVYVTDGYNSGFHFLYNSAIA